MRVSVDYDDERLELDLADTAVVGVWNGPAGATGDALASAVGHVLEHPIDFPPCRQMVVPGDRVAIAVDDWQRGIEPVLHVLGELLGDAGVESGDITVVATPATGPALRDVLPRGMAFELHDPASSRGLAYLATTKEGRRIYLNRNLTDADVVIPVGRLGFDPVLGYRGAWSVIFPGLSDQETNASYRSRLADDPPDRLTPRARLDEAFEVSWLLGTQFHVGLVPGRSGLADAVAGLAAPAREQGIHALTERWNFRAEARSECVVAGIGGPGDEPNIDSLVEGLVSASRLVHHGGKIVALSRASGPIGPSLQRLIDNGEVHSGAAALRGHEADIDSVVARRLAQVLTWADVFVYSKLDRQVVEDLGMIPLDHVDDGRRLAARSSSCLFMSRAELTRATVHEP
jgi:nickel-dependent lactate racemase